MMTATGQWPPVAPLPPYTAPVPGMPPLAEPACRLWMEQMQLQKGASLGTATSQPIQQLHDSDGLSSSGSTPSSGRSPAHRGKLSAAADLPPQMPLPPVAIDSIDCTTAFPARTHGPAGHPRPCAHNLWTKIGKKHGRLILQCKECPIPAGNGSGTIWKTRPEYHTKCVDFFQGKCAKGAQCPAPHIFHSDIRTQNGLMKDRKRAEAAAEVASAAAVVVASSVAPTLRRGAAPPAAAAAPPAAAARTPAGQGALPVARPISPLGIHLGEPVLPAREPAAPVPAPPPLAAALAAREAAAAGRERVAAMREAALRVREEDMHRREVEVLGALLTQPPPYPNYHHPHCLPPSQQLIPPQKSQLPSSLQQPPQLPLHQSPPTTVAADCGLEPDWSVAVLGWAMEPPGVLVQSQGDAAAAGASRGSPAPPAPAAPPPRARPRPPPQTADDADSRESAGAFAADADLSRRTPQPSPLPRFLQKRAMSA